MRLRSPHWVAYHTYQSLPSPAKNVARKAYQTYVNSIGAGPSYKKDFVVAFFDSLEDFETHRQEFEDSELPADIEAMRREHEQRTGHGQFAGINQFTIPRMYALVRKLKPTNVVETGVCNGLSSFCVLSALERNGHGQLLSVDYPDEKRVPDGESPGWIVPDSLRHRWELTIGKSQEELPEMIDDIDQIDLFLHDTKASILDEELELVWSKIPIGGAVIADDVHDSDVFPRVVEQYSVDAGYMAPNVGYMIKRS